MDEDKLNTPEERNFWRSLRDPEFAKLREMYLENEKMFAEHDKRVAKEAERALDDLISKIDGLL